MSSLEELFEEELDMSGEVVFGENETVPIIASTLEQLEQVETLLRQTEEIEKLFVTNVDGTKVPKLNYFEELSQFNESQKKVDKVEGQFYRFMFRWTEHERNKGFGNPEYIIE